MIQKLAKEVSEAIDVLKGRVEDDSKQSEIIERIKDRTIKNLERDLRNVTTLNNLMRNKSGQI